MTPTPANFGGASHNETRTPEQSGAATGDGAVNSKERAPIPTLSEHTDKWKDVCEELKVNHPQSSATLWTSGYVFGLRHAADMASRSINGAANVQAQCTPIQPNPNLVTVR